MIMTQVGYRYIAKHISDNNNVVSHIDHLVFCQLLSQHTRKFWIISNFFLICAIVLPIFSSLTPDISGIEPKQSPAMASPALTAESSASSQRMLSKDEASNSLKKSCSDCSQIGYKFVKDYYTTLNQDPSLVHVRAPLLLE